MATTPRSEAQDACPYCHGKLSIIVSRDPDEEVDCVCTDPPELKAITFAGGRRSGRSTVECIVKGVQHV